jgi:hypothetical protein
MLLSPSQKPADHLEDGEVLDEPVHLFLPAGATNASSVLRVHCLSGNRNCEEKGRAAMLNLLMHRPLTDSLSFP